jgi:hypothetical protein
LENQGYHSGRLYTSIVGHTRSLDQPNQVSASSQVQLWTLYNCHSCKTDLYCGRRMPSEPTMGTLDDTEPTRGEHHSEEEARPSSHRWRLILLSSYRQRQRVPK